MPVNAGTEISKTDADAEVELGRELKLTEVVGGFLALASASCALCFIFNEFL